MNETARKVLLDTTGLAITMQALNVAGTFMPNSYVGSAWRWATENVSGAAVEAITGDHLDAATAFDPEHFAAKAVGLFITSLMVGPVTSLTGIALNKVYTKLTK